MKALSKFYLEPIVLNKQKGSNISMEENLLKKRLIGVLKTILLPEWLYPKGFLSKYDFAAAMPW